jgi:hypothetical protein
MTVARMGKVDKRADGPWRGASYCQCGNTCVMILASSLSIMEGVSVRYAMRRYSHYCLVCGVCEGWMGLYEEIIKGNVWLHAQVGHAQMTTCNWDVCNVSKGS